MVEVGSRIVCVEIFEHCLWVSRRGVRFEQGLWETVVRWVRTYPPMDRVPSVGGLGLVKYWWGGGD